MPKVLWLAVVRDGDAAARRNSDLGLNRPDLVLQILVVQLATLSGLVLGVGRVQPSFIQDRFKRYTAHLVEK